MDLPGAENGIVGARRRLGAVQIPGQGSPKDVVDQSGFAAARDAGDADKGAERKMGVEILQVVLPCAGHAEPTVGCAGHQGAGGEGVVALGRHADPEFASQIASGQ